MSGDQDWLDPSKLLLFAAFVLPGFIAWKIGQLRLPAGEQKPQDVIFEVLGFGIANALLVTLLRLSPTRWTVWPSTFSELIQFAVAIFLIPTLLSLATGKATEALADLRLVVAGYPTAWDGFVLRVLRRRPSFVVITLRDGRKLGGGFARTAFASNFPNRRDIFVDRVWEVDQASGEFLKPVRGQIGLYVCGKDILMLEVYDATRVLDAVDLRPRRKG